MAAATIGSVAPVLGSILTTFHLTSVADASTFTIPQGGQIVALVNKTSASASLGYTLSGNTATIKVSTGTPDIDVIVAQ